jgi:benzoate/toluate 1,2-dioxygenase subunit beta
MIDAQRIAALLYREARLLDDRGWDEWLTCYTPDATYWMPAWDDDDQLTTDPQSQISLIYYPNRQGLEDRVFRIKTERSGASMPEPRTSHFIGNIEAIGADGAGTRVRYNWQTLSQRYNETTTFFGTAFVTLVEDGDALRIAAKTIVLKNDYIPQVIDIYHI